MGIAKEREVAAFPVRYFLLALGLHAALLVLAPPSHPGQQRAEPLLPLQLHLSPRGAAANTPPLSPEDSRESASPASRNVGHAPQPPSSARDDPAPVSEPSPKVDASALIEAARHQIREKSRQRGSSIFATASPIAEESRANPIARAMERRQAGERMLPGEILQITTEAGSVYCLQAPPMASPGGLKEALAVPSNCP